MNKFKFSLRRRVGCRTVLAAVLMLAVWGGALDLRSSTDGAFGSVVEAAETKLWTCGMHPQVLSEVPGNCPICGMKLTPVHAAEHADDEAITADEDDTGDVAASGQNKDGKSDRATVTIDPVIVQNMGVRTVRAEHRCLTRTIRATATLEEWQPGIHDVTLRVRGWLTRLYADTEGMMIEKGDPLLDVYSPDLHVAVTELIAAHKTVGRGGAATHTRMLLDTAKRKLTLYGLDGATIARLSRLSKAPDAVTILAPASGHVTHKEVVEGSAVEQGEHILRIVDHSKLWVDLMLPESQLDLVNVGDQVTAEVMDAKRTVLTGAVSFIHPHVEAATRTGLVRFEVENPDMALRPGMYARAEIDVDLAGHVLAIPREAVLDSGTRQIVFRDRGKGRFEPLEVRVGPTSSDGWVEVIDGVGEEDSVVVSGQFLLDTESRLREALAKFMADRAKDSGAKSADPSAGSSARGPGAQHAH